MDIDEDEQFSWKVALIIMLSLSLVALVLRLVFKLAFFNPAFEASLLYVPTIALFAVWMRTRSAQE